MPDANLTYKIIGCAMRVHSELGPGLREKPYENALCIELREQGYSVEQQRAFPIVYHDTVVGDCTPDMIVEGVVIVDTKSIDALSEAEGAQMLNYLRIAKLSIGLVLNFKPPKLEVKRVAL